MSEKIIPDEIWKNLTVLAGLSVTAGLCAGLAHLWYGHPLSQALGPLGTGLVFGMSSGWLLFMGWLAILYQKKSKAATAAGIRAAEGNAGRLGGPLPQEQMQDVSPYKQGDQYLRP